MSCIGISLIAVLRLYYKDEADKISRSECKKFDRESQKAEITVRCWTFDRHETEKIAGKRKWMGFQSQKRNRKRRQMMKIFRVIQK